MNIDLYKSISLINKKYHPFIQLQRHLLVKICFTDFVYIIFLYNRFTKRVHLSFHAGFNFRSYKLDIFYHTLNYQVNVVSIPHVVFKIRHTNQGMTQILVSFKAL